MRSLHFLLYTFIEIYIWLVIIQVIMHWLFAFNVINMRNPFVNSIGNGLYRLTEPALVRIRRFLPDLGSLDISPVVLILLLVFARSLLNEYWPTAGY